MRARQRRLPLPDCKKVQATALCAILWVGFAVAYPNNVEAQFFQEADGAVRVGDRWVYDTRDEMAGLPKETYTEIVTELSAEEAIVNVTVSGSAGAVFVTYDRHWNCIDNLIWRFRPSNGGGGRFSPFLGKKRGLGIDGRNKPTGEKFKETRCSKVLGQENVTTAARTVRNFKIEM